MSVDILGGHVGDVYTTDGAHVISENSLWVIDSCFRMPSVTMRNIKTGELKTFGTGGTLDHEFRKIGVSNVS